MFVISAGNIGNGLFLPGVNAVTFEDANDDERRQTVRASMRASTYDRTLLAPAEALNGMTVGAVSKDLNGRTPPDQAGVMILEGDAEILPQITSALGLGPHRAIKPDLLGAGGRDERAQMPAKPVPNDSMATALRDFWRQVFMTSETEMNLIVSHPRLLSAERSQWEDKRTSNVRIEYFQN